MNDIFQNLDRESNGLFFSPAQHIVILLKGRYIKIDRARLIILGIIHLALIRSLLDFFYLPCPIWYFIYFFVCCNLNWVVAADFSSLPINRITSQ